jgi:glycosyltransferase 2 family protein
MRGFLRKLLLSALALGALAALAYLSRRKIHLGDFTWSRFSHAVSQANVWLLLISIFAVYGAYALRTLRWQRLSRYLGPSCFVDVYSATVMGFASIFILGRAGEPVRPLILARKTRQPVPGMFGVWVLERITDFGAAVALAALSLLVFAEKLADAGLNTEWVENARAGGWLLLAMLAGVVILMLYFRLHGAGLLERRLHYWKGARGFKGWLAAIISGFSEGLQAIRTWPDLLITVVYTCAHWALVTLAYLWIARAFAGDFVQSDVTVPGAMLLLAITLVGSVLQLPGVGGGAQVASFIALTTIFGVEQEPAAAIAIVLWLITFASSTLVGVPLLIHEGLSMGELRNLARAEAAAEKAGEHVSFTRVGGHGSRDQSARGGSSG